MSNKRSRTPTPPETSASVNQPHYNSFEPVSKATRTTLSRSSSTSTQRLLCTLPPTCNPPNHPTPLANSKELETHYATYHAHVCENLGCGCVFPEARLLELVSFLATDFLTYTNLDTLISTKQNVTIL